MAAYVLLSILQLLMTEEGDAAADNRLMGELQPHRRPYRSHGEYARRLVAAPSSGQGVFSLPRLHDYDMVELHHLRSFPSLSVDTSAGPFSIQSSGLVMRSIGSDDFVVLEYRPVNYSAAFLPVIGPGYSGKSNGYGGGSGYGRAASDADSSSNNTTPTPYLAWDRRAVISYSSSVDTSYWQQSTFLGTINGVVFENYVKWLVAYQSRDSVFVPYSICSGSDELSCFTTSQTWETFLADSLQELSVLEVNMHTILPPRASEIQVLSFSEPLVVLVATANVSAADGSAGNANTRRNSYLLRKNTGLKVYDFFNQLISCMQNYQLEELSSALRSCMSEKDGFLYKGGDEYYRIRPRHPFVLVREYLQPIPAAAAVQAAKTDVTDVVIAMGMLVFAIAGLGLSLYRLKVLDYFVSSTIKVIRRRAGPPSSSRAAYRGTSSEPPPGGVLERFRGALFGGSRGASYERVATDEVEMVLAGNSSLGELDSTSNSTAFSKNSSSSSKLDEGTVPTDGAVVQYELHVDSSRAPSPAQSPVPVPAYRSVINFNPTARNHAWAVPEDAGAGGGWKGRSRYSSSAATNPLPDGKSRSPVAIQPITMYN